MSAHPGESYRVWLEGMTIPDEIAAICDELERQGWQCTNFMRPRGLRFLCPGTDDCKHAGLWISTAFVPLEFIAEAVRRTCLTEFSVS